MKKIQSYLWKTGAIAMTFLLAIPAAAQKENAADEAPMLITPHEQSIGSQERTLCYDIKANIPFEVADDAEWVKVRKEKDGSVFVHVLQNYLNESRTANITFTNVDKALTRTLTLRQDADRSVEELPTDSKLKPYRATDNNHQDGNSTIMATLDGNNNTLYHSKWSGSPVNPKNPAILTYEFRNVDHLDYINYVPRPSNGNGNFGEVELYIKQEGDTGYKLYNKYDWKMSGATKTIRFKDGLKNPTGVQFKVLTGYGDFASCAEMEFCVNAPVNKDFDIFADDVYSKLKEGVTEEDIENISTPFVKSLAYKIFNGQYDTNYRVADYECILSYVSLAEMWNAPGKHYDQIQGVTGINIPAKSKQAIVVSGIPEDVNVELKVVAWYVGKIGSNFDGGNPETTSFALRNGLNVIDYKHAYDGLAYICYYADKNPEKYSDIKVHFVNGQINGYLSPEKTNIEMQQICKNAKNRCMDIFGKKVHAIWEADALYKYCRSNNGQLGYRQYMNVLDSLIVWEHRSLGLEKYNRIPKNKTMAYVNYTYYMFQGGFGVSFHMDQQSRVLNCKKLIEQDDVAIWGLSHEWGHQHQMHPHFCWSGMSEVSNNMQSYYNVMKMGYRRSDKINAWKPARAHFLNDHEFSSGTKVSKARQGAYEDRNRFSFSPALFAVANEMKNATIPAVATNKVKGVAYAEVGIGEMLCPLIMLHNYFTTHGYPDFMPDWYESLRQSDDPNGSQVEKKGAVDKYEIIASCQNHNKNGKLKELREKYPNSCWVKDKLITEQHCNQNDNAAPYIMNFCRKVSRLTGYNLFPYFEQWGYFRQVAIRMEDYGMKYFVMTENMYNEFKADMDALVQSGELKEMPEGMVNDISNSPDWFQSRPTFPN